MFSVGIKPVIFLINKDLCFFRKRDYMICSGKLLLMASWKMRLSSLLKSDLESGYERRRWKKELKEASLCERGWKEK